MKNNLLRYKRAPNFLKGLFGVDRTQAFHVRQNSFSLFINTSWTLYSVVYRPDSQWSDMAAAQQLNKNNEVVRKFGALLFNISAAKSLQNILATNLGPRGTMKM